MGFTIEDMLTQTGDKYQMKLLAGSKGWSNSISWILMIEDMRVLQNFKGKDLAVTTGLGFQKEEQLLELVEELTVLGASGLIINTGRYIHKLSDTLLKRCDNSDFPLITVPWDVQLYDMIKDLNLRMLLQGLTDEQIVQSLIRAMEQPEEAEKCRKELLPYFDVDGDFQIFLLDTGDLDSMDTVERRRIGFQVQIYLESISHNASFFYYDGRFVLVTNAVPGEHMHDVIDRFLERFRLRFPDMHICVGAGSAIKGIENIHIAYGRAKAAAREALGKRKKLVWFDDMGNDRILSLVSDHLLTNEMGRKLLEPLIEYDNKHGSDYLNILEEYIRCQGSVKTVSERLFIHRNTVIYQMGNIKKILGCDLEDPDDRLKYQIACILNRMYG